MYPELKNNANSIINNHNTNSNNKKYLKMDKRLPIIILPSDKLKMFQDWWNQDIRFEQSIPKSFNSGYLKIDGINIGLDLNNMKFKSVISCIAKQFNTTYRFIENQFVSFIDKSKAITLYFNFIADNKLYVETYGSDDELITKMNFTTGSDKPEKEIDMYSVGSNVYSYDDMLNQMNYYNLAILASVLWYISTTTNSTKYIYENRTPMVISRKKNVVQVSDTKYISTPIYDFNKIKIVKVDTLQTRKRGWTYSHSFQVHGHYRHYRNGKVIFIEPFIKGKNKEFKSQQVVINPS